mgnify:CR=1 FL=1
MKNEKLVQKWLEFADMDFSLAQFTFANMHPKPLELICYHCQQAAEKALSDARRIVVWAKTEIEKL